jgi:glycine betaine catabolism B
MHEVDITQIRQETPTVKSFRLALSTPTFSFWPGQWVDLYIDDPLQAPDGIIGGFSMTSSPLHRDYIELAIKRIPEGRASMYLHDHISVGDRVIVDGGYGDFYYREDMGKRLVLIAGGIGITPLMSIIRFVDEAQLDVDLTLIYSAKRPSEFVFFEELQATSTRNPRIHCYFTVTAPEQEPWTGAIGRVRRPWLTPILAEGDAAADALYFICGPRGFAEDIESILNEIGIEPSRIHYEGW